MYIALIVICFVLVGLAFAWEQYKKWDKLPKTPAEKTIAILIKATREHKINWVLVDGCYQVPMWSPLSQYEARVYRSSDRTYYLFETGNGWRTEYTCNPTIRVTDNSKPITAEPYPYLTFKVRQFWLDRLNAEVNKIIKTNDRLVWEAKQTKEVDDVASHKTSLENLQKHIDANYTPCKVCGEPIHWEGWDPATGRKFYSHVRAQSDDSLGGEQHRDGSWIEPETQTEESMTKTVAAYNKAKAAKPVRKKKNEAKKS
jgi:hypothetical protein